MTTSEFHAECESIMAMPPGSIKGSEDLRTLDGWDSLAVISFIAMVDENFSVQFSAGDIAKCNSVNDLRALLGDRLE